MLTLEDLGWDRAFAASFEQLGRRDLVAGRVVRADKLHFRVQHAAGLLTARLAGRLLRGGGAADQGPPAVGDWVAVKPQAGRGRGTIRALLPRRSKVSRKVTGKHIEEQVLAANIDTVFLVSGLDADHNLRRIERYLALTAGSGAEAVIVLNKADLCSDVDECLAEVRACAPDVPVHATSAIEEHGLEVLEPHLRRGRTVALLGSSGAGKSTLVNALLGEARMKVGELRDDGRGQHTTTHRELILLPAARGVLIDTPGLRALQMWGDREQLDEAFPDVAQIACGCRFNDCVHEREPGCAVLEAVERDRLLVDRYDSYLKLRREMEALALRRQEEVGRMRSRRTSRQYRELADTRPRRRG